MLGGLNIVCIGGLGKEWTTQEGVSVGGSEYCLYWGAGLGKEWTTQEFKFVVRSLRLTVDQAVKYLRCVCIVL